ncbi:restriction endonuclease subunit S [Calothrix sp. FACHB-156]|nr:restriction endonuclease subunit S [Calothrix sp. FACHB-156]
MNIEQHDEKRFLIKASNLTNKKLFVEFYQPKYQFLLDKLNKSPYPLYSLKKLSKRMFDGPFGSNRKVDMYQESGIPYIRVKDVLPSGISFDELTYISEEKHNELIRSRVVTGTLLITIAGRVGTAAVFPETLKEGNITGHIVGIELIEEINPYYVAAFINSQFGEFQVTRLGHRTTRLELNLSEVGEILIPLPPRKIQDKIAQVSQDAYIKKNKITFTAKQILEKIDFYVLESLGISLNDIYHEKHFIAPISKFLGRRFDVGAISKEFQISDYSHISWINLHEVAELPTSTKIASRNPDKEYIYIGMPDVDEHLGEVNLQTLLGKDIKANKIIIKGDDIVFARIEPCIYNLKIALIPSNIEEALGSTELLIARPKPNILPSFLLWILRSKLIQSQILGKMTGTTGRRRLPNNIFASLKLPKICLDLQKLVASEATQQRDKAKLMYIEAENLVIQTKAHVERMILGEEDVA